MRRTGVDLARGDLSAAVYLERSQFSSSAYHCPVICCRAVALSLFAWSSTSKLLRQWHSPQRQPFPQTDTR